MKVEIPGIGDIGGLLPDRIGDLIETRTRVGFSVELAPSLAGAGVWVLAVLAVALLVSRRGRRRSPGCVRPPRRWGRCCWSRWRPGWPRRCGRRSAKRPRSRGRAAWVLGAALLGAPNGSWLGVLLGLFVPVHGQVTGAPAWLLPDPMDDLLAVSTREPVTVARLAEYDERAWLLVAGAALLLLYAGVLAAVRTPGRGIPGCAARMSAVTGVTLAVLAWLTGLSADASLAVLGVDAVDAGVELRGDVVYALVLGAVWGAVAGGVGAGVARWGRAAVVPGAVGVGWPVAGAGASTVPYGRPPGGGDGRYPPPGGAGPGAGPYGGAPPPSHQEPHVSWDVTVTGIPPRPPGPPKPGRRPPFTPPPPPGAPPPPPKPSAPPR